jgi:hypothetical protein
MQKITFFAITFERKEISKFGFYTNTHINETKEKKKEEKEKKEKEKKS